VKSKGSRKADNVSESAKRSVSSHDPQLQHAIESVFRLTHQREMTLDERRMFGLSQRDGHPRKRDAAQDGNSPGDRSRRNPAARSPLPETEA